VVGVVGTFQDISDRKQTELKLQKISDRLALALSSGAIGYWEWDIEQNSLAWDAQMYKLYGGAEATNSRMAYETWANTIHPDDHKATETLLQEAVLGLTDYDCEFRVIHPDHSIHFIKAYGKVEKNAQGKAQSMIGVNFDISDRKQSESQLKLANQELLRATKLKDEFLATMSHELRTPLNSILGLSESLKDEILGSINDKQLKALSIVESSGEHLLSLINDILDLSKISSGMMTLDMASVPVQNLCDISLLFVKQQAFNKRIQIHSNIPAHINNINIDERRIKQVLINLLTNAVKFTPNEGKVNLFVAIGSGDTWQGEAQIPQRIKTINSPTILFQVVDTGIGINSRDLKILFQPFVQVDSALNRQYEGTGLGLALVKQIVELHGGQVMVDSEVGQGSSFTVALPYEMSQSNAIASAPTSTTAFSQDVNPVNPPLILLAEDNEANIQTFISYLTAVNYRVIVAQNGVEAIAQAKANLPDIILMDIQMPIMDGLEATKQIRLDPNLVNIPIIALTALAMEGDQERCLAAGANSYIAKPVKLRQLNLLIQQALCSAN
jgi:signal transduction histidine kinase/ActR/RegA family two-component response regulator